MDLKELLGEDLFKQVTEKAGDAKLGILSKGKEDFFVPKHRLDEEIGKTKASRDQVTELQKQVEAAGKDLEALKKSAGDAEGLKAKIEELQRVNKETLDKANAEKKSMIVSQKIQEAVAAAAVNPKYLVDVKGKIDLKKIVLSDDGETAAGIAEQIESVKKTYPEWFGEVKGKGPGYNPGENANEGEFFTAAQLKALTPEQMRDPKVLEKANASLAKLNS